MTAQVDAEVRTRQAARLERKAARGTAARGRPSRWAHVKLAELFAETGNVIYETSHDGELETGHQPFHNSKRGRCLRIDTNLGLWYCRSCGQGGDAVTLWTAISGHRRKQAAIELAKRYGPPKGWASRSRRAQRRAYTREVTL